MMLWGGGSFYGDVHVVKLLDIHYSPSGFCDKPNIENKNRYQVQAKVRIHKSFSNNPYKKNEINEPYIASWQLSELIPIKEIPN